MGQFFRLSRLLAVAAICGFGTVHAQEPAPGDPPPPPPEGPPEPPGPPGKKGPPGERERFEKHLKKWEELSDEEKDKLRERGKQLFERGRREVEKAISELDVELSPEKRREFIKTYMDKRREIERKIWEETEPRRQELIAEAVAELKKTFGKGEKAEPSPAAKP